MSQSLERPTLALSADHLSEIVSALAHEIRNPLTGISINVQYLQMVYSQSDTQAQVYSDILESVKRLEQMVCEFADFIQPRPLNLERVDLNVMIQEAFNQHNGQIDRSKILISTCLESTLPLVEVDPERFRRALAGLAEHCLLALESGGQIAVVSKSDLTGVILELAHSGRSLSPQRLQTIFDPLTALKAPESGFGMALVRKILEEHQCQIHIDSQHGGWTRFFILFPLHVNTTA